MLTSEVYNTAHEAAEDIRIIYTDNTHNSAFTNASDAGDSMPFGWENSIDKDGTFENIECLYDGTNDWVYIQRVDNGNIVHLDVGTEGDNTENAWWSDAVTTTTIRDEVVTATVQYKTRVIDNDNAQSIMIEVYLDDGTDNTLLWYENATKTESTTWTAHENNVIDNVTAAGTYRIWIGARINPDNAQIGSLIQVGFDEVSLEITNHTLDYGELSVEAVGDQTGTVYKLAAILLLVIVAFAILKLLGMV